MVAIAPPHLQEGMPLANFLEESHQHPIEIINGRILEKMVSVSGHSYASHALFKALLIYTLSHPIIEVMLETTFALPSSAGSNWVKGARIPDVLVYLLERLEAYKASDPDWDKKPYFLVPDITVEVVSENDSYAELTQKVQVYLQDGVKQVWIIDPKQRSVVVHHPKNETLFLTAEDTLTGGDLLPNFSLKIGTIFA